MSNSERPTAETERTVQDRLSSTRRDFLQVTGMAALATGVGAQTAAAATQSAGPGAPGRISDLAAYLEDPEVFEENVEPTHVTTAVPYKSVEAARRADEPFTELEARFAESEYVHMLDGEWQFAFHEAPSQLPDSYEDLAAEDWGSIQVPGVWQTQGYDQRLYTNNSITWDVYDPDQDGDLTPSGGTVDVPGVDDDGLDPVGTYRRTFSVPEAWDGRATFLHFEAVKQAFFVWIDGEYVGFRSGSMTPAEFDVGDHVEAGGDHQVTVQVYRWSDSEALETIDMFRYSGIFRSVYLFATPTVHLRDFYVRSDLDEEYEDGHLRIDAEIANYGDAPAGEYEVRAHLYETDRTKPGRGPPHGWGHGSGRGPPDDRDPGGGRGPSRDQDRDRSEGRGSGGDPGAGRGPDQDHGRGRGPPGDWDPGHFPPRGRKVTTIEATATVDEDGAIVTLETDVEEPAKWSAEHPNLYQLGLELAPSGGEPTEAMLEKVGFRTYEITRGQHGAEILVNGEPVDVQGVNRHETDPDFGRTVPIDRVREDIETMQRFNVNAIRTSHYPNDPSLYRLADEYGIYVQDEVCVETHWWGGLLENTEAYHDQAVAQFRRMVLRDRNHASIFSWSTGNEAGTGAEHLEMATLAADSDEYLPEDTSDVSGVDTVESFDGEPQGFAPDRLLYHQPNGGGWNVEYSDMLGPRYPDVGTLLSVADGSYIGDGLRPVVMGEYNHAMGNSLGLVHEMWNEHIKPPVREATDRNDGDNPGALVGSPEVVPGPDAAPGGNTDGAVSLAADDAIEIRRAPSLDVGVGLTVGATIRDVDADAEAPLVVDEDRYALRLADGEIEFSLADGEAAVSASTSSGAFEDWTTVVGVASSDELAIHVDGERLAATGHSVSDLPAGEGPVRIGAGREHGPGDGHDRWGRGGWHDDGRDDDDRDDRDGHNRDHRDDRSAAGFTVDGVGIYDRAVSGDATGDADGTLEDGAVVAYDFADLLRDKSLAGGFVWDWVNQDLNDVTEDGEPFQFYHSDGPDGAFCLNGLVWSDRDPQPELWQLKHAHQPVGIADAAVEDGEIYVSNRYSFSDLGELAGWWELTADAEMIRTGYLPVDLDPGETRRVDVGVEAPDDPDPGVEYRLTVRFVLVEDTDFADVGHEVAFEQLEVPVDAPEPEPDPLDEMPSLSVEESDAEIAIAGDDFDYVVDADVGTLSSMAYDGSELLDSGPLFSAWRAPIMNEIQQWGAAPALSWYDAGLDDLSHRVESVETSAVDDSLVEVTVDGFAAGTELPPPLLTPDSSGAGNDGEVVGGPEIVPGQSGQAVALDGASQYIDAGNDASIDFGTPGFTVQVRFQGVPTNGENNPFVSKGDHQYSLKISDSDEFEFFVYQDTWIALNAAVPSDLAEDEWHTLTGVATDDELLLYLNGSLLASRDHSATSINQSAFPVHVGHNAENTNRYTETTIDAVRLFDRPLSASEITSGFDEPPESAVLWYDLDTFEEGEPTVMGFETRYRYSIFGSGDVRMQVEADPNQPLRNTVTGWLPKVGVQLELLERFDAFEWYGRGELETYPDRKWGVPIGRHAGSVDEQYVPYLPPTDNGNKAQTRWATLSDGDVSLLGMPGDEDANVSLEQWANLDEAEHQYELEERGSVGFNLDHRVTGLGGTPTDPIDRYQVEVEPTSFSVVLRPFDPDDADPMALANRTLPDVDE